MRRGEHFTAVYHLCPAAGQSAEKLAQSLALGQTVETWTALPGQSQERLDAHKGEVLSVTPLPAGGFEAHCSFPIANTELDVATLLVTLLGKPCFAGLIRLVDVLPGPELLAAQPGPGHGVAGVREATGCPTGRPLTMSIFKPCVGLPVKLLAEMFAGQCRGGIDLVKDDEILPDIASAPTTERLRAMREVSDRECAQTGKRTLYVVNLTGPVTELVDRAAALVEAGAQALLVNVLAYSFGLLAALARDRRITVPLMAHPALAGALCGDPQRGLSYALLLGRFMRWAGADIVLFPAQYGSHAIPAEDALALRDRLLEHSGELRPALPGPSAGVHPGMTERIIADYGANVVINAGGGVQGHPDGGEAGALALRQSVDWVMAGNSLRDPLPPEYGALQKALALWGVVETPRTNA